MDRSDQIESILADALEIESEAERRQFVERACGGDAELRREVEELIESHVRASGFFERLAVRGPEITTETAPRERPGTVIGPYKLVEQIGEGGFGTVFVAEQRQPVRRQVALKVLKPGMDTAQVVARFEAERQALALMNHPNIAQVFDGGETATGRPYFVMELVKGIPITKYCDEQQLSPRERLALFVPVCEAVQHAHQKGIIHRDIKPSNVLVAAYDGRPVPKVIDFGVAKALGQQLTERTLVTNFGGIVGTLEYMSPEQAEFNALDIDTRADIYGLGVLLYELLTGTTPLTKHRTKEAALTEILRLIREEEPPTPSTRLGESSDSLASISALRKLEPSRLTKEVRGELDWIVMKCLEKERTRRYETANGLARDIQRFLNNEPLEAGPPSATYKLRKFARKHRTVIWATAAFVILLAAGAIISTWQAVRATVAEKAERQAKESAEKRLTQIEKGNEILTAIFRNLTPGLETEQKPLRLLLTERLEEAASQIEEETVGDPLVVAGMQKRLAQALDAMGSHEKAIGLYNKARATFITHLGPDHLETLKTMSGLGSAYYSAGKHDLARAILEETLPLMKAKLGPNHTETITCMGSLAAQYRLADQTDLAIPLLEEALRLRRETLAPDDARTLNTMNNLGLAYLHAKQVDLAISVLEETHKLKQIRFGPDHPQHITTLNNLSIAYRGAKKLDLAYSRLEDALRIVRENHGPDHPHMLTTMSNIALTHEAAGKQEEAISMLEQVAQGVEKRKFDHALAGRHVSNLIDRYEKIKRYDQAEIWRRKWLAVVKEKSGPGSVAYAAELASLAANLLHQKKWADAEAVAQESLEIGRQKEPDAWGTFHAQSLLGAALSGQKRYADAEPLLLQGYQGMKSREASILKPSRASKPTKSPLIEASERLVELYEGWGKEAEAARWRKELDAEKARQK